jgi:hypothetical protein
MGDWNGASLSQARNRYAALQMAVRLYNDHLRTVHPEFRHWKRKLSATYAIPTFLPLVSSVVDFLLNPTSAVNFSVLLPFWFAALLIGLVIISVRGRGTRRYREQWLQEHGQPPP